MKLSIKYPTSIVIFACIVVLITGWMYLQNELERYNSRTKSVNDFYGELQANDSHRKQEFYYNGKELSQIFELSDTAMSELRNFADGDRLVLYLSDRYCDICIHTEMSNLADSKQTLKNNVILFIKSDNKRYITQFKINHRIDYPCIHVKNIIDTTAVDPPPFYFIIEKSSRRMNNVFIPQREKPDETASYFAKILTDYFQQE